MIMVREIIATTALAFGFAPNDLLSDTRAREVMLARHVAMYVARKTTTVSSVEIGRAFGGRDHTSVLHAIRKIEVERYQDQKLAALINSLIATVEFREKIAAFGGIDVLTVARRIAAQPQRRAMAASVMEIAALAATLIDLWEIARAAEHAAGIYRRREALRTRGIMSPSCEEMGEARMIDAELAGLFAAITDEMAALCGEEEKTDEPRSE